MKKIANIISLMLVILMLSSCSSVNTKDAVAKVNDTVIKTSEFEKNLALTKKGYEGVYGEEIWTKDAGEGKTYLEIVKGQVLDKMISDEIKYQEAVKQGIKADPKEIEEQLKQFKSNIEKDENIKKFIQENSIDDQFLKTQLERELVVMEFEQNFKKNLNIDEAKAKEHYEKNKESYRENKVKASHILIKTIDDSMNPLPADEIAQKKKLAEEVLKKVKAGEDFAELAKKYSEDEGSAKNGGDLNYFGKGVMLPEFEEAAFVLEKGEISDLVETKFGYHIIKVYDKIDRIQEFKEVKDSIVEEMKQSEYDAYIEKITKAAKVENYLEKKK